MATNVFINNQQPPPRPPPQPLTLMTVHSNQWSTGICDCFDDLNTCCFAYWCFPCFACKTASEFGECFCLPLLDILWTCMQTMFVPSCVPPIAMSLRVAVRHRYGIQGNMTSDCIYATFCNTCSWCQVAREIKRRKQVHTVINAQPGFIGGQQFMMTTQSGVINSQPMMSVAPSAVLTSM